MAITTGTGIMAITTGITATNTDPTTGIIHYGYYRPYWRRHYLAPLVGQCWVTQVNKMSPEAFGVGLFGRAEKGPRHDPRSCDYRFGAVHGNSACLGCGYIHPASDGQHDIARSI
jgi:hypothetical protein